MIPNPNRHRLIWSPSGPRVIYRRRRRNPKDKPKSKLRDPKPKTQVYVQPIRKVLANVHPDMKISKKSLHIMNRLFEVLLDRLAKKAICYRLTISGYKRMDVHEVRKATELVLGEGQLLQNALSEGDKAVKNYREFHERLKDEQKKPSARF